MDFRYLKFDPQELVEDIMQQLLKIWNQFLLQTNGDADEALRYLERIWERIQFPPGQEVTFAEFKEYLEEEGLIREGSPQQYELTERGERKIRTGALEEIFSSLKMDVAGNHRTPYSGEGTENLPETRPYRFGDRVADISFTDTIRNSLQRDPYQFHVVEDDLEVYQKEHMASCATALLVDISHSMVLYGEDRITPAKKVAIALSELIRTRYPKDSLDVILFGDDAIEVPLDRLPYVGAGPYHTNTKAGLELARKLLLRKKHANRQVFMITDGKPSAIYDGGQLYLNSFGLDPKIVTQTINEAVLCRRKGILITTFMVAQDPYLQDFVNRLSRACKGQAYFASPDHLGEFIFADFVRNRKKKIR